MRSPRLRFGTFLAPHHPLGESPTLQFQRDLELATHLDHLGFDEFWCGEHHSSGWEMIASPEMFLAAAGQVTHTIKLGTGVVSLPYHHPFNVAQRIVQLDHMTKGRAMFGSGPGALPSDARTMGISPMVLRDRQDEAMGVIIRLLNGEDRFSYDSDWFTLHDAALQILPIQERMPMATASSISPSGMQIAGKYGIGVLSIASNSVEGLQALPTQWGFAEEAAAAHGTTVDRANWRVLMSWHIAETKEQARREAVDGLHRWHNEYNVRVLGRPGAIHVDDPWDLLEQVCRERRRRRRCGGDRHTRRPHQGDRAPAADHRRLRCRARLRPRLGQPREQPALVGPRRPLRHPGAQRFTATDAGVGRLRRGQQGRVDRRRVGRGAEQDPGPRGCRGGDGHHHVADGPARRGPPGQERRTANDPTFRPGAGLPNPT